MITVLIGAFVFAAIAMNVARAYNLEKWIVSIGLMAVAVGLYYLSFALHKHFIRHRAPELSDSSRGLIHSSATHHVPRWVSHITSLSFAAILAAVVPWVVTLVKWAIRFISHS